MLQHMNQLDHANSPKSPNNPAPRERVTEFVSQWLLLSIDVLARYELPERDSKHIVGNLAADSLLFHHGNPVRIDGNRDLLTHPSYANRDLSSREHHSSNQPNNPHSLYPVLWTLCCGPASNDLALERNDLSVLLRRIGQQLWAQSDLQAHVEPVHRDELPKLWGSLKSGRKIALICKQTADLQFCVKVACRLR